jgi:hypothetical protein
MFRFLFWYWLLYSLPLILGFPITLAWSVVRLVGASGEAPTSWWAQALSYLAYPGSWFQQAMNWFTPWVSNALLGVEAHVPTEPTGSGDGLFAYCTSFACLVVALVMAAGWTAVSETWRAATARPRPSYDRLHALLRLVLRFHLLYMMLVYGGMKIWCAQFPPISDAQLEGKYGDSSPMGILWRFMQASQPYTTTTGIIEFICGVLLIWRRTTLLGALCAAGATFQVFMLNMCYDVPVKLMSGHLLLMALTLIAPDAGRLFSWLVLGRAVPPKAFAPIFGPWTWLNRTGVACRTVAFVGFAALTLHQDYRDAVTRGILAPENPVVGRWVTTEFRRDGQPVPFPPQPENPPPQAVTPAAWQGGPGMPAVVRVGVSQFGVTLMFGDGSGTFYRNLSDDRSELRLVSMKDQRVVARLRVTLAEPDRLMLEGPLDGQEVRITLRRVPTPKRDYVFRSRSFQWVQERPFNP